MNNRSSVHSSLYEYMNMNNKKKSKAYATYAANDPVFVDFIQLFSHYFLCKYTYNI